MLSIFAQLDWIEYVRIAAEIIILTICIYRVYVAIADTKAVNIIAVVVGIALVYVSSLVLKLDVITTLLKGLNCSICYDGSCILPSRA